MSANNTVVVSFSIAILLLLSLLLLLTYNSRCASSSNGDYGLDYYERFDNDLNHSSPATYANKNINVDSAANGIGNYGASDPTGNEIYNRVENSDNNSNSRMGDANGANSLSIPQPNDSTQSCYPRDRLSSEDLLPKDAADSKWARLNPSGSGDVHDQNYLTAGYHIGVNTVGQSLRNANLQLRSEIPNPQNAVGPWMISTIEPDYRAQTLEIGSSPGNY
jgi:hypothetical protein